MTVVNGPANGPRRTMAEEKFPQDTNDPHNGNSGHCFGHVPGPAHKDHFQLGCFNASNIPAVANDPRNNALFKAINCNEVNALSMQETGINWSFIPRRDGWNKTTEEVFARAVTHPLSSFNTTPMTRFTTPSNGRNGHLHPRQTQTLCCGSR